MTSPLIRLAPLIAAAALVACGSETGSVAPDPSTELSPSVPAPTSIPSMDVASEDQGQHDVDTWGGSHGFPYESASLLVVRGGTARQVAKILDADLSRTIDPDDADDFGVERTVWSFHPIEGGVLGVELSGYGDPTRAALVELSTLGGSAAVVRDNIDAMTRFGAASDGRLVFDDNDFAFIDDPIDFPQQLRQIAIRAWVDLSKPLTDTEEYPADVGMEMAAAHTGLTFTRAEIKAAAAKPGFSAPALVYLD